MKEKKRQKKANGKNRLSPYELATQAAKKAPPTERKDVFQRMFWQCQEIAQNYS